MILRTLGELLVDDGIHESLEHQEVCHSIKIAGPSGIVLLQSRILARPRFLDCNKPSWCSSNDEVEHCTECTRWSETKSDDASLSLHTVGAETCFEEGNPDQDVLVHEEGLLLTSHDDFDDLSIVVAETVSRKYGRGR
jgi:hypothetical protein